MSRFFFFFFFCQRREMILLEDAPNLSCDFSCRQLEELSCGPTNQPDLSEALLSESCNFSPDCFAFTEQLPSCAWHDTCGVLAECAGDLLLIFNSFCQDSVYPNNLILITASSICHSDYSLSPFKETDHNFSNTYTSITCKNSWDPVGSNQYLLTD